MYPVSDAYKVAIKQITRTFQLVINVFPADNITMEEIDAILATVVQGVPDSQATINVSSVEDVKAILSTIVEGIETPEDYVLYDNDIVTKTFKLKDNFVTGEDIEFGNAIVKDLAFTLTNYEGQWNNVDLERATIIPMIGLLTEDGYEYVPMGTFWADEVSKPSSVVSIKAMDGMARLGVPFAEVEVGYPCDARTIFFAICDHCGIRTKVTTFTNDTVTVQQAPEDIENYTCRDMLAYLAMLAGCNARMSRDNYLEFVSYGSSGECSLGPTDRKSLTPEDYCIRISGLEYEAPDETLYYIGTTTYMLSLPTNPLMPADPTDALNNLLDVLKTIEHQPFSLSYFGDPAIDCGDRIINTHSNGKVYKSYVTNSTFTFKGPSELSGKGRLPEVYSTPTKESKRDAKIVSLIRKNKREAEQKFSTLEQSIVNATNFMTQELGGYVYKTNNALYVMDTQDLETAKKLWKWGLGGFGYSANGKNGPFTTAITMDGQIVADFITAGTMSGERIQAGTITADTLTQSLLLAGDRISIQSTNFTLDWDGSITCNDATLYGDFTTDIATIDNEGVNVYYGCLNVFKGSKSNPGAYALHIEPYYTLINGGFQSSDFGMSMAVGAILNEGTTNTYSAHFLLWDNKTNTMSTPILDIWHSTQGNLVLNVGSGANKGILKGTWDVDQSTTLSHALYAYTLGVVRNDTLYGQMFVTAENIPFISGETYKGLKIGVKNTSGNRSTFISMNMESAYSDNRIGNLYGTWNINGPLNIYNGAAMHGGWLEFWYDNGNSEAGFVGNGKWGDKNILLIKSDGVPLYMTYADDSGNDGAHIVLDGSNGTFYGTFDFNQEQFFSHTINVPAFICRSGSTKKLSAYVSSIGNPCFNSDQGNNFVFQVSSTSRIVATSSGGNLYGTWYLGSSTTITSDATRKNSIEDLPEAYINLIYKLRPVRYKYNDGTSGRFHTGLIAQDVAQALDEVGIPTEDFAGYVEAKTAFQDPDIPSDVYDEYLALRYEEFIGLLIGAVQELSQRVKTLEAIIQGGEGNGTEGQ